MIQGIGRFPVQYAVIASRGSKGNYLFCRLDTDVITEKKKNPGKCADQAFNTANVWMARRFHEYQTSS